MNKELLKKIKSEIKKNDVMMFIKGTPEQPMCGFSACVIDIFNELNIKYSYMNIFDHEDIKPTLVAYTNWQTTPQVFIKGELIGGCDIVRAMNQSGELQKKLQQHGLLKI